MHQSLWTFFTIVFVIRQVTFDIHLAKIKKVLSNYMIAISVIVGNNKKNFYPSCGISNFVAKNILFSDKLEEPKKTIRNQRCIFFLRNSPPPAWF